MISHCSYAVGFEQIAQDAVSTVALHGSGVKDFKKDASHLITAENSLLTLSSYPSCTDGILYAFAFKFEINNKNVIYTRYFSSTIYTLFACHSLNNCTVYNVYTYFLYISIGKTRQ